MAWSFPWICWLAGWRHNYFRLRRSEASWRSFLATSVPDYYIFVVFSCTNVVNSGFRFLCTRVRKFLLTEERNVFSLGEYSVRSVLSYLDCSFLRCLIGASLCWFALFWCSRMVLSLWHSFSYTLVWFSSLQLRKRMLFLRSNSIFSNFGRCLGHFCLFECGEIIKLIENAFMFFWATFFILYIRLPCSSHKWRRSIPSLIGNFHSDLRAIYLLRDFSIPVLIMLSLQQGIRSWNIVTFLLESIVHSLHSIYFFYWWKYAHIIVHPHFRIIVHFNYSFPYSALSFSAYFSVNWLAQNSKLASGSGDT